MVISICSLLALGVVLLIWGIRNLTLSRRAPELDLESHKEKTSVIKIRPQRRTSIQDGHRDEFLVLGEVFNSSESTENLGEIQLMSSISSLFRADLIEPELVILAEERMNLYVADEIWERQGGRAKARESERDAHLSSMSYRDFVRAMKKIVWDINPGGYDAKYVEDDDTSYDNLMVSEDEVIIHEDSFPELIPNPDIVELDIDDFEVDEVESPGQHAITAHEDVWKYLEEGTNF